MPLCKNINNKYYIGTENTPLGKGYSASGEKIGTVKKGKNNQYYVVEKYAKGKKWVLVKNKTRNNISPRGYFKNISNYIEDFYLKNYEVLNGPYSITYFILKLPDGRTKKILAIGEVHTKSKKCEKCLNITDFITKIIKRSDNNNLCIDFFIERSLGKNQGYKQTKYHLDYHKDSKLKINNTIDEMRDYLESCHTNTDIPCLIDGKVRNNIRIQNWDLRFKDRYSTEFIDFYELFKNYKIEKNYKNLTLEDKKTFIKYFLGYEDISEDNLDIVLKKIGINTNKYLFEEISILRKKIQKEYNKFLNTRNEYFPKDKYDLRTFMTTLHLKRNNLASILTDFYIVIRMFRTFNNKNQGPFKCKNKNYLDHSILYGGENHIKCFYMIINYYYPEGVVLYSCSNNETNKNINFDKDTYINKKNLKDFSSLIKDFSNK